MRRLVALAFALLLSRTALRAADAPGLIPAGEAANVPAPTRVAALAAAGAEGRWAEVAAAARTAVLAAYAQDRTQAAGAWLNLQQWAQLFGQPQREFINRGIPALQAAKANHPNMPTRYETKSEPLGTPVPADLRAWLMGNAAVSDEFFALLSPLDYVPGVFAVLTDLWLADPARFKEYPSLALAIAVVYDVPPPPDWPHGQVSATALPRRLRPAREAFAWWVREDKAGRTYHRLTRLGADELKFVVDAAAPAAELEWAQGAVKQPLAAFADVYPLVRYRMERVQAQAYLWPGATYRLADILQNGGICVDQAYFASESGKARGIPTLLFRGEGLDGRHAWFGFLDGNQAWQLDAGRYAEQRFVTGLAQDPQTWTDLSDHELKFLSGRFRALPAFAQSRVHARVAAELLRGGDAAAAATAARKAVNYEKRNLPAWETLLAAQKAQGVRPAALEGTLREAAQAFQQARVPDLEIGFAQALIASLRGRGETSQADNEERQLVRKYQTSRTDLAIQQAGEMLKRSFATQAVAEQIRTYNTAVDNYGRGAGIEFFDEIVVVFAEHLQQLRENAAALEAVERARRTLRVEPGKQLEQEINRLAARLRGR
jgi:hypothetical protein